MVKPVRLQLTPRESLARALRLNRHGEIRPLWEDPSDLIRDAWREQADFIIARLKDAGVLLELASAGRDDG